MKLKNLCLFFIISSSLYIKAQSIEMSKSTLSVSHSLLNDSSQNNGNRNLCILSIQDSKLDSTKFEHVTRQSYLKVSEALKVKETKAIIHPENK
jgi:hypothetical protein